MGEENNGNRIKMFLDLMDISISEFSVFCNEKYSSTRRVISAKNISINTAKKYLNKLIELSDKKTEGKQILFISIDDLFES